MDRTLVLTAEVDRELKGRNVQPVARQRCVNPYSQMCLGAGASGERWHLCVARPTPGGELGHVVKGARPRQTRIDPPEGADSEWYLPIPLMLYHR